MQSVLDVTTIAFVGLHTLVVLALGIMTARTSTGAARWLGLTILPAWFAAASLLSVQPWVHDFSVFPPPLAVILTVSVTGSVLAILFSQPVRRALAGVPTRWIVGVQAYRVLGVVFLLAAIGGIVPLEIGLVSGVLDILIGLTAPVVAVWATHNTRRRWVLVWNVVGLADFTWSITLGLLAAPPLIQAITLEPGIEILGQNPFSLITLWAVPFSITLHAISLQRLLRARRADRGSTPREASYAAAP